MMTIMTLASPASTLSRAGGDWTVPYMFFAWGIIIRYHHLHHHHDYNHYHYHPHYHFHHLASVFRLVLLLNSAEKQASILLHLVGIPICICICIWICICICIYNSLFLYLVVVTISSKLASPVGMPKYLWLRIADCLAVERDLVMIIMVLMVMLMMMPVTTLATFTTRLRSRWSEEIPGRQALQSLRSEENWWTASQSLRSKSCVVQIGDHGDGDHGSDDIGNYF